MWVRALVFVQHTHHFGRKRFCLLSQRKWSLFYSISSRRYAIERRLGGVTVLMTKKTTSLSDLCVWISHAKMARKNTWRKQPMTVARLSQTVVDYFAKLPTTTTTVTSPSQRIHMELTVNTHTHTQPTRQTHSQTHEFCVQLHARTTYAHKGNPRDMRAVTAKVEQSNRPLRLQQVWWVWWCNMHGIARKYIVPLKRFDGIWPQWRAKTTTEMQSAGFAKLTIQKCAMETWWSTFIASAERCQDDLEMEMEEALLKWETH